MIPFDSNLDATSSKYHIEIGQAQGAVFGDSNVVINHFTVGIRELPTDYAARVKNFLTEYLGLPHHPVPFGGRIEDMAYLDAWLADQHAPPYLLLAAPAGRGKSALLARWGQVLAQRDDLAIAYFPVSIRFRTNLASVVFPALTARLAKLHGEKVPTDLNITEEMWCGLLSDYLERPLPDGRPLLIILDGVDEAADWEIAADLFPLDPPAGLRVVLAARYLANDRDAATWLNRLGWTRHGLARVRTLHSLDQAGVANVLQQLGFPLDHLSADGNVVAELHRLSEGDPLLVRLYVDELWKQGEGAARLQATDMRAIRPGLAGYFDRWWEEQRRLWSNNVRLREPAVQTLLNLLACAFGPLTRDDLLQLAPQETGFTTWIIESTIEPMKRFVIGDGYQQGYVFSHSRLATYFYERLSQVERQQTESYFVQWGQRTLESLIAGQLAPRNVPAYLVQYYGVHLERSDNRPNDFLAFTSQHWCQAWSALEGSYIGFLNDVDRTWRAVERADQEAIRVGRVAPFLWSEIHCALCHASIMSLAGNIPPKLIAELVKEHIWSAAQGLANARQKSDPDEQSRALAELAPLLPYELLKTALEVVRNFEDNHVKVRALVALAMQLPREEQLQILQLALEVTRATQKGEDRSEALSMLVPHLPPELLGTALEIAYTLSNAYYWQALPEFAPYVSQEQLRIVLEQALSRRDNSFNESLIRNGLTEFVPYLSEELLSLVLKAAYTIENEEDRTFVLLELVPQLPLQEQRHVIRNILMTAYTTQSEWLREKALIALAPYLWRDSLQIALHAVRSKVSRIKVQAAFAAQLPLEERVPLLLDALEATLELQSPAERADALEVLAPHLPDELLDRAVGAAYALNHEHDRAKILTICATRLPLQRRAHVVYAALKATSSMADDKTYFGLSPKVSLFKNLAPRLSSEMLMAAIETALTIEDGEIRARVLTVLVAQLPQEKRLPLLHIILEILSALPNMPLESPLLEWNRAQGLEELLPYLPQELLDVALDSARAIRDDIERGKALAELAANLVGEERQLVIDAIHDMKIPEVRAEAYTTLASHLTPEERIPITRVILEAICSISSGISRASALMAVIPHLSPAQLGTALEIALALPESNRAMHTSPRIDALLTLIPYLSSEQLDTVLEAAPSLQPEMHQAKVLISLIPFTSARQLDRILEVAYSIKSEYRLCVLAMLVSQLPAKEQFPIIRTFLEGFDTNYMFWSNMLEKIAQRLSPELLSFTLKLACSIKNEEHRGVALSKLAPYLSSEQLDMALEATRSIANQSVQASTLAGLALYLSSEHFSAALEITNSIQKKEAWTKGMAALASHLPYSSLEAILKKMSTLAANAAVYALHGRYPISEITAVLAPHLPPELMSTALKIACTNITDTDTAETIAILAPYLPPDLVSSAFEEASKLPALDSYEYSSRARALSALGPYIPDELLSSALDATYPLLGSKNLAEVFSALSKPLTGLSSTLLYPLWQKTLHMLQMRDRADLLLSLAALLPVITKLGGQEALVKVAQAIINTGHWWP